MKTIENHANPPALVHALASALNNTLKIAIPFGDMDEHQKDIFRKANVVLDRYVSVYGEDAFPGE